MELHFLELDDISPMLQKFWHKSHDTFTKETWDLAIWEVSLHHDFLYAITSSCESHWEMKFGHTQKSWFQVSTHYVVYNINYHLFILRNDIVFYCYNHIKSIVGITC